ncbi:MAG: ISAs1 family transposase [Tannerellaceae bacterium]|nr:ISAs1 family transposase [Tannerellaceae bacterium]
MVKNEVKSYPISYLPNGVSSVDTFEMVFKCIDSKALEECLHIYEKTILSGLFQKQVILDGKKQCKVSPTSRGNNGLYLLNVWVSENKFCIAQKRVEDKSNEITAIPELFDSIDMIDFVVTIGTQKNIAKQIRDKDAHYLLSVKGNQQDLLDDVECAFKTHTRYDCYQELDYGHGRIETRKCSILKATDYLLAETIAAWKDVTTLVKVESIREIKDVKSKGPVIYQ